ncbi:MAG TPA: hypothetical protein VE871_13300 [Longimicrobium sp.]|nr:hypothetical protein [Longimicrobium sp.]
MDSTTPPAYAGFARDMRERFLARPPAEWGMVPTAEAPDVYGVLMEWRAEDAAITVAAFCDGSASVYSTRGPGMIGGDADDVVRSEASALVRCAADLLDDAAPAALFPYPDAGRVQFYLLTFAGVRVLEDELDAVYDGRSPLAGLYDHGWAVFERFVEVTHRDGDEGGGCGEYRKEWSGADGYVSCVLTALSRGIGPAFAVSAAEPVPDLVALSAENDELQEWLAAQEFPYESMDAKEVVRAIRKAAGIVTGLPFLTRRAELPALCTGAEGEPVACVFDIEAAPWDRAARIELAPPGDRRVVALQRQTDARHAHAASG